MASHQIKPLNVWAVGRNYKKHAEELGNKVPTSPIIFLKAGTCVSFESKISLPNFSKDIHHECEIFVRLGPLLKPASFGLALDLTARDTQEEAKKNSLPWTLSKSFKSSCPIGPEYPFMNYSQFNALEFSLTKNESLTQTGNTKSMIFNLETLVEYITDRFPVAPNDIILTGTPEGVGPLKAGDRLKAQIKGFSEVTWIVK